MKIYIAGKITGKENYRKAFDEMEEALAAKGHSVMNPARMGQYPEFTWNDYVEVGGGMMSVCDAVLMLSDWKESRGAMVEHRAAVRWGMRIFYSLDEVPEEEAEE